MKLLVFPHSHFCEKARWALDAKGIPFQPVPILPGFHIIHVRRYAPKTSVPVLLNDDEVIQGAGEIIDYLDMRFPESPLTPTDAEARRTCLAIESSMDERLGEDLRQILYSGLLAYPDFIRFCFTFPMSTFRKSVFFLSYPFLRRVIHGQYVFSIEAVEETKDRFRHTMDELAEHLKGRKYFVGDHFSRADLSIASMLSLLVRPPEHTLPWREFPDPQTRIFAESYERHPVTLWVREIYRTHRNKPQSGVSTRR